MIFQPIKSFVISVCVACTLLIGCGQKAEEKPQPPKPELKLVGKWQVTPVTADSITIEFFADNKFYLAASDQKNVLGTWKLVDDERLIIIFPKEAGSEELLTKYRFDSGDLLLILGKFSGEKRLKKI